MSRRPVIGCSMSTTGSGAGLWQSSSTVNRTYTEWLVRAGGLPLGLPNTSPELIAGYLQPLDGLLLTGGEDVHPLCYGAEPEPGLGTVDVPRDTFELPLARAAVAAGLPVLGICRGIQTLNVALGGTLIQDLKSQQGRLQHSMSTTGGRTVQHTVSVEPDTRLAHILGAGPRLTNSYHHQAVDVPAPGLAITARAADGVIEAVEASDGRWILGVQWHPEVMEFEFETSEQLFAAFVAACAEFARQRS